MSNVIQLNTRFQEETNKTQVSDLITCFAANRQPEDSVFWLKENAELLNILECTGMELSQSDLLAHSSFYEGIESRIRFFQPYYRFLLSICLDLEDLGLPGSKGEAVSHWIAQAGLPEAELSDLQRAEARRMLARRNVELGFVDPGLDDRLRLFAARVETFALPNKKAAYELTHILFYLSEYGRRDPMVPREVLTSLEYAGLLAYLEQNADLLAEVCIALRYAGSTPPAIWENWLERQTQGFVAETVAGVNLADDYHDFFVCNWAMSVSGRKSFVSKIAPDGVSLHRGMYWPGPLREISECMFGLGEARSGDWQHMRPHVESSLSEIGYDILVEAEQSSPLFEEFFASFSRSMPLRNAV